MLGFCLSLPIPASASDMQAAAALCWSQKYRSSIFFLQLKKLQRGVPQARSDKICFSVSGSRPHSCRFVHSLQNQNMISAVEFLFGNKLLNQHYSSLRTNAVAFYRIPLSPYLRILFSKVFLSVFVLSKQTHEMRYLVVGCRRIRIEKNKKNFSLLLGISTIQTEKVRGLRTDKFNSVLCSSVFTSFGRFLRF